MNTEEEILNKLIKYVKSTNVSGNEHNDIPVDESLLELGILDSFGIVELVVFIEKNWSLEISDEELNEKNFKGLTKMSQFIFSKLNNKI